MMAQATTDTSAATSGELGSHYRENATVATCDITWHEPAGKVFNLLPEPTYITGLDDDRYTLIKPIPVEVDLDPEGGWVAFVVDSSIGMPGESREAAINELKGAILDIYEAYSEDTETLGPGPAREWSALRQYIDHRR